jgi:ribosomal protein S12 methylthiotransferase accessory factor
MGFDLYIADYEHLNVYCCRIIVPGMSDIYPVDDLVWNNNNEGALFREEILSLKQLDKPQWQSILNRLDEGGYNDYQRVAEFIGIAPDPGTGWAQLRIGELKAMLCLALNDDAAIDWIDWCLHTEQLDNETTRFYLCLKSLLEINMDEQRQLRHYSDSLKLLFGEQTLEKCLDVISGKENFAGLHSPGLSLEGFNAHNKLLEGYKKLHLAKLRNWQM